MSKITHITSAAQLEKLLASPTKLSIIDFHATWCGPCHAIAPKFEALSKEYAQVQFLKCDVDACQEVAQKYSVSAMPTFILLKGSQKVDQVRGADPRALESAIRKHAGQGGGSTAAFAGKGQTLGGTSSPSNSTGVPAVPGIGGITNIDPQVKLFLGLVGVYVVMWWFS